MFMVKNLSYLVLDRVNLCGNMMKSGYVAGFLVSVIATQFEMRFLNENHKGSTLLVVS
jgi:hypothetical protein